MITTDAVTGESTSVKYSFLGNAKSTVASCTKSNLVNNCVIAFVSDLLLLISNSASVIPIRGASNNSQPSTPIGILPSFTNSNSALALSASLFNVINPFLY